MIVDAVLLVLAAVLLVGGLWILWNATVAWQEWRR